MELSRQCPVFSNLEASKGEFFIRSGIELLNRGRNSSFAPKAIFYYKIDKTGNVHYDVHEVIEMTMTNVTNFRKNIFSMLEQAIKYNETINISTKDGNAVVLSEEEYRGMMETIYLMSIPEMKEKLIDGKKTPLSECISENEVEW